MTSWTHCVPQNLDQLWESVVKVPLCDSSSPCRLQELRDRAERERHQHEEELLQQQELLRVAEEKENVATVGHSVGSLRQMQSVM